MLTAIKLKVGVSRGPVGSLGIKGVSLSFSAISADGKRKKVQITPYDADLMRVYCPSDGSSVFITVQQYKAILQAI